MPTLSCAARRVPDGDPEARPGDHGDERQNEDARGTTPGLSETHRRPQGVPLRQGGTLQHAAGGRGGVAAEAGREESTHRKENATTPTGEGEGCR